MTAKAKARAGRGAMIIIAPGKARAKEASRRSRTITMTTGIMDRVTMAKEKDRNPRENRSASPPKNPSARHANRTSQHANRTSQHANRTNRPENLFIVRRLLPMMEKGKEVAKETERGTFTIVDNIEFYNMFVVYMCVFGSIFYCLTLFLPYSVFVTFPSFMHRSKSYGKGKGGSWSYDYYTGKGSGKGKGGGKGKGYVAFFIFVLYFISLK